MKKLNPPSRSANCLFCDDVRQEVGGKFSLMGMYGSDLIIPAKLPTILPRLCFVLQFSCAADDNMKDIQVVVKMKGIENVIVKFDLPPLPEIEHSDDIQRRFGILPIPVSPFPVSQEGILEVYATIDGETARAGRLVISSKPDLLVTPAGVETERPTP